MTVLGAARRATAAVVDLVVPNVCAGCGAPDAGCCGPCGRQLRRAARAAPHGPVLLRSGPPVWAAVPYDGTAATLLVAYKDGGRRDLVDVLADPLAEVVWAAACWAPWASPVTPLVVPVPSARAAMMRRGDRPLEGLALAATRRPPCGGRLAVEPVLRVRRRVADQSRLGRHERARNLSGAFEVARARETSVAGRGVVLVDDIVTSGATLAEAERALRVAGAVEVRAAVVAATPRRRGSGRSRPVRRPVD